jgi:hypothetical protein
LFDVETVKALLEEAGFGMHHIYRYAYGTEPNPVNLGFMAWKKPRAFSNEAALLIIKQLAPVTGPNLNSLELGL